MPVLPVAANTDGYQESMTAINKIVPEEDEEKMRALVNAMFSGLGLSLKQPVQRRKVTLQESDRLVRTAQLGAKLRTGIPRDRYDRSVVDLPSGEIATRMAQQMTQLYLGLEIIGVNVVERWHIIDRVARDSMPLIRARALEIVQGGDEGEEVAVEREGGETADGGSDACQAGVGRPGHPGSDRAKVGKGGMGSEDGTGGWRLTEWPQERLMGRDDGQMDLGLESQ